MKTCLLRLLVFVVLLPVVFSLPPLGFALFCFIAYTMYFWQKYRK